MWLNCGDLYLLPGRQYNQPNCDASVDHRDIANLTRIEYRGKVYFVCSLVLSAMSEGDRKPRNFYELPMEQQEKIFDRATRASNEEQAKLMKGDNDANR